LIVGRFEKRVRSIEKALATVKSISWLGGGAVIAM